jgi:hypothetical protein
MASIFISYRREDSVAYAGRLYDRLNAHFGAEHQVFIDVDTLDPGVDFVEKIEQTVGSCDVLIAVIGKLWLTAVDEQGRVRLQNPEDFVRLEIQTALDRKIRVIPALVGGARMPGSQDLPSELAALARRNAFQIHDDSFRQSVSRLIESLERALAEAPATGKPEGRVDIALREAIPRQPSETPYAATPPPVAPPGGINEVIQSGDPPMIDIAKPVFLPPRRLSFRLIVRALALAVAGLIVLGVGYLKYKSIRRVKMQSAIIEKLQAAPSETLRKAAIRVFVSDDRQVTLDGKVSSPEDAALAASLAGSVSGVNRVTNRLIVPVVAVESSESLINKGVTFLDAGDYPSAIDCFRKAFADPNNKGAKELLDRAQRAQQTEEELLKNRR